MRFLSLLTSSLWLMEGDAANRYNSVLNGILERRELGVAFDPQSIETQSGKRMEGNDRVSIRDGVATINIEGPIVRKADYFDDISGATSTSSMAAQFASALSSKDVKAILLNIHSPGGQAFGINEFAAQVYEARGIKPVVAYVDGMACSAAYWIAAAADEIVTDAIGTLGSIGCVWSIVDDSKQMGMLGLQEYKYISERSPLKHAEPGTRAGNKEFQQQVNAICEVFGESVALYRGVDVDTVWSDFGKGGVLIGQAAVDAGLADRIGSYEQVLSELASGSWSKSSLQLESNKPDRTQDAASDFGEEMTLAQLLSSPIASMFGAPETKIAEGREETMNDTPQNGVQITPLQPAPGATLLPDPEKAELQRKLEEATARIGQLESVQSEAINDQLADRATAFNASLAAKIPPAALKSDDNPDGIDLTALYQSAHEKGIASDMDKFAAALNNHPITEDVPAPGAPFEASNAEKPKTAEATEKALKSDYDHIHKQAHK